MSETMNTGIRGWGGCLYVDGGEGRVLLASASIKQQEVLGSLVLLRTQGGGTMNDQGRSWWKRMSYRVTHGHDGEASLGCRGCGLTDRGGDGKFGFFLKKNRI